MNQEIETKKCSNPNCLQPIKPITEFYFRKESNTYRNECKLCQSLYNSNHFEKNKQKRKFQQHENYIKNKEYYNKKRKIHYKLNKDKELKQHKVYNNIHKEKIKEWRDNYCRKNKDIIKIKNRLNRIKNRKKINEKRRIRKKIRYNEDKIFRFSENLKSRFNDGFRKKKLKKHDHMLDIIGLNNIEIQKIIESKFEKGMTWGNYPLWHVDHIVPISFFNIEDNTELKICWNPINLRPMWANENISKNDAILDCNFDDPAPFI